MYLFEDVLGDTVVEFERNSIIHIEFLSTRINIDSAEGGLHPLLLRNISVLFAFLNDETTCRW